MYEDADETSGINKGFGIQVRRAERVGLSWIGLFGLGSVNVVGIGVQEGVKACDTPITTQSTRLFVEVLEKCVLRLFPEKSQMGEIVECALSYHLGIRVLFEPEHSMRPDCTYDAQLAATSTTAITTSIPTKTPENRQHQQTGDGGPPGPAFSRERAHAAREVHAQEPEPTEVGGVFVRELPEQVPRQGRLGVQVYGGHGVGGGPAQPAGEEGRYIRGCLLFFFAGVCFDVGWLCGGDTNIRPAGEAGGVFCRGLL